MAPTPIARQAARQEDRCADAMRIPRGKSEARDDRSAALRCARAYLVGGVEVVDSLLMANPLRVHLLLQLSALQFGITQFDHSFLCVENTLIGSRFYALKFIKKYILPTLYE